MQMRQRLHGLAQAHVVSQYPRQAVFTEELQPVQPRLLIGSQRRVKALRGQAFGNTGKIAQALAEFN